MNGKLLPLVGLLVLSPGACSTSSTPGGGTLPASAVDGVLTERQLAGNVGLRASLDRVVVLDLERPGSPPQTNDTGGVGADAFLYTLPGSEPIEVCIPAGGNIAEVLLRKSGAVVFRAKPGECNDVDLDAGDYEVTVSSNAGASTEPTQVFVHSAVRTACPNSHLDFAKHSSNTYFLADLRRQELITPPVTLWPAEPPTSQTAGVLQRVHLSDHLPLALGWTLTAAPEVTAFAEGAYRMDGRGGSIDVFRGWESAGRGTLLVDVASPSSSVAGFRPRPDLTPFSFRPFAARVDETQAPALWIPGSLAAGQDVLLTPANRATPDTLDVAVIARYADPLEGVGELTAGEVALYSEANFGGHAWVVNTTNAAPVGLVGGLDLPLPLLPGVGSFKLGCDTTLETWPSANKTGARSLYTADGATTQPVLAYRVRRTRQLVFEEDRCVDCNLARADFADADLRSVRFVGGSLQDAVLDRARLDTKVADQPTRFEKVILSGASFAGATLSGAQIDGVDDAGFDFGAIALTNADLSRASIANARLSRSRLDGARLVGASLTHVDLDLATTAGADFTDASLRDVRLTNVADLSKATLLPAAFKLLPGDTTPSDPCNGSPPKRPNRLSGSTLTLAQLPFLYWRVVDMTGVTFDTTAASTAQRSLDDKNLCNLDLHQVRADGLSFHNARMEGLDLRGASFTSSSFVGAALGRAKVSGASFDFSDFSDAVLDGVVADEGTVATRFDGTLFVPRSLVDAKLSKSTFDHARIRLPVAAKRTGLGLTLGSFVGANFGGCDLTAVNLSGGRFQDAAFTGAVLTTTVFRPFPTGTGTTAAAQFANATFCGATLVSVDFTDALLAGAVLPRANTTVPSLNRDGSSIACAQVKTPGFASLDDALVTSASTQCPSGATPRAGHCAGDEWNRSAQADPRACPAPASGDFEHDNPRPVCAACVAHCDCLSQQCNGAADAGTCGPCGH